MFSALAENPDFKHKINSFIAMAPVIKLDYIENRIFEHLAQNHESIEYWLNFFKINELFGENWEHVQKGFCLIETGFC